MSYQETQLTELVYDIRNPNIGYISIELYKPFKDRYLKLYKLTSKNYGTMEYLKMEKHYSSDEQATEQLSKYAESILGFTREQMRKSN